MRDRGVGAAVPVVVHAHDSRRVQYAGGSLHFVCEAISPWADRPLSERGLEPADIGTAPGVCFLLDVAAARRAGMFDPRYFMGKEDGEFCYRLRVAGYRIVEVGAARVDHGSRPRSTWLYPFQIRNRWHFMLKNYEVRTLIVLAPALLLHEVVQFAILAAKGHAGAWFRAARELGRWLPSLAADRRTVAGLRRVSDRALLGAAPLVVRADIVGGSLGRSLKSLYDAWLSLYWRSTSWLLR
jgi:GT2 family glycosyltransferase